MHNFATDSIMFNKSVNDKLNFNKGNYEDFRQYMNLGWDKYFYNCMNDICKMWNLFKSTTEVGINRFIPKVSKFGTWKIPLNKDRPTRFLFFSVHCHPTLYRSFELSTWNRLCYKQAYFI